MARKVIYKRIGVQESTPPTTQPVRARFEHRCARKPGQVTLSRIYLLLSEPHVAPPSLAT
jgi:hypothetical protein